MLQTEGVNFQEMFKYDDIIDMQRIYSNDIYAISQVFGIEAATRAIVKVLFSTNQTSSRALSIHVYWRVGRQPRVASLAKKKLYMFRILANKCICLSK